MSLGYNPSGPEIGDDILGLIDYHRAVLDRRDLAGREAEFRSSKLSLILDLIRTADIPDDLMDDITSAVVSGWRMTLPDASQDGLKAEMNTILNDIEGIRQAISWARSHPSPLADARLDALVQFYLPMTSTDIEPDHLSRVQNLLVRALEHISSRITGDLEQCSA